ncbi:MAG: ABC transporter permease [Thermodesulfobacteriota bacterium]
MSQGNKAGNARGGSAMRLKGLMRKEFHQILRDPSSIAIAFLMPVVLLFLFGYGVSLDSEHVPVGIVTESSTPETESFIGAFRHSRYLDPVVIPSMTEAISAMLSGRVNAIVRLRADFSRDLAGAGQAPIQVIVNGVDANSARIILGYVQGVWGTWLGGRARAAGTGFALPVTVEQRVWFNSRMESKNFLVPGLIAVIMTLIGALLTAMVMAREYERGTMEALMVTPVAMREIILGKLIPYFIMGMGGMCLSLVMGLVLFRVPLRGSVFVLMGASALFLLVALGMGLFISISAKNQFVAGQAAIITTYLPAFLLSGFIFDIASMPPVVQFITHIIGARYFVAILQTVFLAGDVWAVILPNALALTIMAAFFFLAAGKRAKKRLM